MIVEVLYESFFYANNADEIASFCLKLLPDVEDRHFLIYYRRNYKITPNSGIPVSGWDVKNSGNSVLRQLL